MILLSFMATTQESTGGLRHAMHSSGPHQPSIT